MASTQPFNADQRAKKRETRDVTVGGKKFSPRRKTNGVLRGFRRMLREDNDSRRQYDVLAAERSLLDLAWVTAETEAVGEKITELPADAPTALRERLAAEYERLSAALDELSTNSETAREKAKDLDVAVGEIEDRREELLYGMVAHLLKAAGSGDADDDVDPDFIGEHIDVDDASDLLARLMPGGDEPDPT